MPYSLLNDWFEKIDTLLDTRESQEYQHGIFQHRMPSADKRRHLANGMHKKFGIIELSQASYLTMIPADILTESGIDLEQEVQELLQGFYSLFNLDPVGFTNEAAFFTEFPSIKQFTCIAILYVVTVQEYLDPRGSLSEWTHSFLQAPEMFDVTEYSQQITEAAQFDIHALCQIILKILVPLTERLGLWHERKIARNAFVALKHPDAFKLLINLVMNSEAICKHYVEIVEAEIKGEPRWLWKKIAWEWRHIATIYDKLTVDGFMNESPETKLGQLIHECGYVSIVCTGEIEQCYRLLGRIHKNFRFRNERIRDYLYGSQNSPYRALHTQIELRLSSVPESRQSVGSNHVVTVRLIPDEFDLQRHKTAQFYLGDKSLAYLKASAQKGFHVYTPKGNVYENPAGTNILQFAMKIHRAFVVLVRGAIINGTEEVGIFYVLKDGDEVRLLLRDKPELLPTNWCNSVPESRITYIYVAERDALRRKFTHYVEEQGKKWLLSRLKEKGFDRIDEETLDKEITTLPRAVIDRFPMLENGEFNISGKRLMFHELGLYEMSADYDPRVSRIVFTPEDREFLLTTFEKYFFKVFVKQEIEFNCIHFANVEDIEFCSRCQPSPDYPAIARIHDGKVEIHIKDGICNLGGTPVNWRKILSTRQFFVVETRFQSGAEVLILSVFRDLNIPVNDLISRRLGYDLGVLRLEVEFMSPQLIGKAIKRLERLDCVKKVIGPDHSQTSFLEKYLPLRRVSSNLEEEALVCPYICGPPITEDARFYGRRDQIATLNFFFSEAMGANANHGISVFIKGRKRIGKTSLAMQFFRKIKAEQPMLTITVYKHTQYKETWSSVFSNIMRDLSSKANLLSDQLSLGFKFDPDDDPASILTRLRSVKPIPPRIVIAVDEATYLFRCASKSESEIKKLIRFAQLTESIPGIMIIWIGTVVPFLNFPKEIITIIERSQPIPVKCLTIQEVRDLMYATKLSNTRIRTEDSLIDEIYRLTLGFPYWIATLGNEMWVTARQTSRYDVFFNLGHLQGALPTLSKLISNLTITAPDHFTYNQITEPFKKAIIQYLVSIQKPSVPSADLIDKMKEKYNISDIQDAINELYELNVIDYDSYGRLSLTTPLIRDNFLPIASNAK
ncbi:TGS domain-containing protein [bacterium]|nr:TGS domain-containing protein [candidate division CSSED10-310 bacterium]